MFGLLCSQPLLACRPISSERPWWHLPCLSSELEELPHSSTPAQLIAPGSTDTYYAAATEASGMDAMETPSSQTTSTPAKKKGELLRFPAAQHAPLIVH